MTHPILYSFRRCPYAMRARLAMCVSAQRVELREVFLRNKPASLLAISPNATIPALLLPDGSAIDESIEIMDWALAQNDPEGWLDGDQAMRAEIVEMTTQGTGSFKRHLDAYKYPDKYENADPIIERESGLNILKHINDQLGSNPYLFGDTPTYSDMALLPFIRQYAHTDKDWFLAQAIPNVQDWLTRFLTSDRFAAVMTKYEPWQEGTKGVMFG